MESQNVEKLSLAGLLTREYVADQHHFLNLFIQTLSRSFPDRVKPILKGFLKKETVGMEIDLPPDLYAIQREANHLKATRPRTASGIKLKTEEMTVEQFISDLSQALESHSTRHQQARDALAELLGLS